MKEFSPQQIEQTRLFFENRRFPTEQVRLGALHLSYWVIPQAMNPDLPDFALRLTTTDPKTKEVSGIFGVSDSIPAEIRPYWAAHEIIEFTKIGIDTYSSCRLAEEQTLSIVPETLRGEFIQRRTAFFTNLMDFFRKEVEKDDKNYSQDDIKQAGATLDYLKSGPLI